MAIVSLSTLTSDNRTRIGAIILDCLLTEDISFESQVTLYPVEDGSEITDHITQGNKKIRISGVISTADVSGGFGFSSLIGYNADNSTKLIDVVEAIEKMHADRALVEVSTAQLLHSDMAFTSLSISRSADAMGGNWAAIRLDLIKIKKVKLKTADVPAAETTAEPVSGRAGETNKPAGKAKTNGPAKTASSTKADPYGPQQSASDKSFLKQAKEAAPEIKQKALDLLKAF